MAPKETESTLISVHEFFLLSGNLPEKINPLTPGVFCQKLCIFGHFGDFLPGCDLDYSGSHNTLSNNWLIAVIFFPSFQEMEGLGVFL